MTFGEEDEKKSSTKKSRITLKKGSTMKQLARIMSYLMAFALLSNCAQPEIGPIPIDKVTTAIAPTRCFEQDIISYSPLIFGPERPVACPAIVNGVTNLESGEFFDWLSSLLDWAGKNKYTKRFLLKKNRSK